MIRFACKRVEMRDVVMCSFGLGRTEYAVLHAVMGRPGTVSQVASKLGLERTGVQKALKALVKKGLVARRKSNLPGGGYFFGYAPADVPSIRRLMKSTVRSWASAVESEINSWGRKT